MQLFDMGMMGSTLKGKNLLLEEQIFSYKSRPLQKKRQYYSKIALPVSTPIHLYTVYLMDGWMTCNFTSFLTVFQLYQDDVWMIMKGCVQWNSVYL